MPFARVSRSAEIADKKAMMQRVEMDEEIMTGPIKTMGAFLNVFDKAGRVLCVRQTYGKRLWTTPGGRVEEGEDPYAAALRETAEEVDLAVAQARFHAAFWKAYADDIVFSFSTDFDGNDFNFVPNAEISEATFFLPNELPTPMAFNTAVRIKSAASREGNARRFFLFSDPDTYTAF